MHEKIKDEGSGQPIKKPWNERAISHLNAWEDQLEASMPNCKVQAKIDLIGHYIEAKFAPLKKFNQWLDSNGKGDWYNQLAIFLAKLPLRAIRNIVRKLR